jgi:formylglycine-generating enzyme required for sulfatase activity
MQLEHAYESLGLTPGASVQQVEEAHRHLCAHLEDRIAKAVSPAIRVRYIEARNDLDTARDTVLSALEGPAGANPAHKPWSVLGVAPGASALDVASAYVSICEEIERELSNAPTEILRRRCLEARAEVDEAYRRCTAAPLAPEEPGRTSAPVDGNGTRYETQVSTEAFEAANPAPQDPEVDPSAATVPVGLRVEPDLEAPHSTESGRRRRRRRRRLALVASLLLLAVGAAAGYARWSGIDLLGELRRLTPSAPDPALVDARGAAEYLRRSLAEERRDLQARAERAEERVGQLERQLAEAESGSERESLRAELAQATARRDLAADLDALAGEHIFEGSSLAVAYGKIELGAELARTGEEERALEAFAEARARLESSRQRLDVAEEALGARSEAVNLRDAWSAMAASAALEDPASAVEGYEALSRAAALLRQGDFEGAIPELQRSSQGFRVALDEGRSVVAAAEAEAERLALAESERLAAAEAQAQAEAEATWAEAEVDRAAVERDRVEEEPPALQPGRAPESAPDVAAPPPLSVTERAAVKLVSIPAGVFYFGCNAEVDVECRKDEKPGALLPASGFWIDRTEVRVDEYARCVDSGVCSPPAEGGLCNWNVEGRGDHPVNCVSWSQASRYCHWVGKRLPTEREWEKAARGTDGRRYPWGDEAPSCERAVMHGDGAEGCGSGSTWPVGSLDAGRSPYGLFDMAGNVLEWTADLYPASDGSRIARGGSWRSRAIPVRTSHRDHLDPKARYPHVGFRCAGSSMTVADTAGR